MSCIQTSSTFSLVNPLSPARLTLALPRLPRIEPKALAFVGILTFVAAVSLYDGYLVIRTGDMIREFEQNPVGVFLLDCGHGSPVLFLATKAVGTTLVLSVLAALYVRWQRVAFPVASAVLLFQAGLLIFLETA